MSGVFGYMQVYCPICRSEMNGMRGYGRESKCCGKACYDEWEWRKTLAILNKPYKPQPKSEIDKTTREQAIKLKAIEAIKQIESDAEKEERPNKGLRVQFRFDDNSKESIEELRKQGRISKELDELLRIIQ